MNIKRRNIKAADELIDTEVSVEPEASELLFEANDVAELVAEITGEPVDVTVDDDAVVFGVGDEEYEVAAEGNEEILEARRTRPSSKSIKASSKTRRPISVRPRRK